MHAQAMQLDIDCAFGNVYSSSAALSHTLPEIWAKGNNCTGSGTCKG